MNEVDKAYMVKDAPEPYDPDPTEEVFASFKALIAVLAVVGVMGMLFAAWWGKL
jgi:hypothetical protein